MGTVFDEGAVPPKLKEECLTPKEINQPRSSHGTTKTEVTRRRLCQDLLPKESRNEMLFKMPHASPLTSLDSPLKEPSSDRLSGSQNPSGEQPPSPRESPVPPREQPSIAPRRTPHTAKHKCINRLNPTMNSSKSYDPPKMANQAVAMMAELERRFGMKSRDSPSLAYLTTAEELGRDPFTGLQEDMHPAMIHSFKALTGKRHDPDLPSIKESLTGPHAATCRRVLESHGLGDCFLGS